MLDGVVKRSARRVAAELRGLPEAERRALAPELLWYAREVSGRSEERVVHVALAGTATLKEIRRLGSWSASMIDVEYGLAVLLDRRPGWLAAYAEWRLTGESVEPPWELVRGLVRAGAIEPLGPPYLSAMIVAGREGRTARLVADDEFAQALLRLAPDGRDEALAAAAEAPGEVGAALRCALGGEPLAGDGWVPAAARAVAGLTPIEVEVEHRPDAVSAGDRLRASVRKPVAPFGSDPLGELLAAVREDDDWGRYVDPHDFPARRDLAAAAVFKRAGWSLGSEDFASGAVAVLRILLAEREPIAPLALRLAVLSLGSISPYDHLLAVDLLIAAIEDGRVDALPPDDVGLVKPNRLAARLQSIAEAGPLHRAVVREFLDAGIDRVEAHPGPLLVLALAARVRRAHRWMNA